MRPLELVSRDLRRLALAQGPLDYVLLRRRGRRGVSLKVDETGLTVSAPSTMPLSRIEEVVRDSEPWVVRKVREWSGRRVPAVSWSEGTSLPFLGEDLVLRIGQGRRALVERREGELHAAVPGIDTEAAVRRAVVAWYRHQAGLVLRERVAVLSELAGVQAPKVFISSAMARWGSCNVRREVRLAWRLVKAPARLIDYVVCHELAHLRHMNHSQAFWAEVERQCPAYRDLRRQLFATDHLYRSF